MKLSFSINSSKSKPPLSRPIPTDADPDADDAQASTSVSHFVTEFDPTKPLLSEPQKTVLAPIPNSDYIRRFKPSLPLPSADDDPSQFCPETNFVLDTNTSADPSGLPYGLSIRSDATGNGGGEEENNGRSIRKREEKPENRILKRFKEDMHTLPDGGGPDEFKGTELGDLAAALLRGYGWKDGMVLGRNKNKDDTKIVDFQKRSGTYGIGFNPTASDPKKNRRGEWIVPDNAAGAGAQQNKDNCKDKERTFGRREEDLERERRVGSTKRTARDERVGTSRRDDKYEERESGRSSRKKERESKKEDHKAKAHQGWLSSHIRVRIISKELKRGKYYLKKGEVVDVVGPTTCDISIDGTRELLQGVEQSMLETALPKKGGPVLVLCGKHKGLYGDLVKKDLEEETALVRDADSHQLVNVHLEQIAEYLGDPSYLGY